MDDFLEGFLSQLSLIIIGVLIIGVSIAFWYLAIPLLIWFFWALSVGGKPKEIEEDVWDDDEEELL